jgi:hypothetical protein
MSRPLFDAIDSLDSELAELSRLHMAFEDACLDDSEAAYQLSAAVGKFLVTRGYEGRI